MSTVFNLVLSVFNLVFRGYIIKVFWGWFIVTIFPNMPTLSVVAAIGLSCFVSAVTPWRTLTPQELHDYNEDDGSTAIINGVLMAVGGVLFLIVGWVIHSLM